MTRLETEHLASLSHHPGFHALLKLLDESDSILLEKLEKSSGVEEAAQLSLWRASRRFRKLIENEPMRLYQELGGNLFENVL